MAFKGPFQPKLFHDSMINGKLLLSFLSFAIKLPLNILTAWEFPSCTLNDNLNDEINVKIVFSV